MEGVITKIISNRFWVLCKQGEIDCMARGSIKNNSIVVGDKVEVDEISNVIVKALPRKNYLLRPPIANLDKLIIVISKQPEPDFYVLDKLLLFCFLKKIIPVIAVNKTDLGSEIVEYVKKVYSSFVKCVFVSAKSGLGTNDLKNEIEGNVCAFAGQSAVGKSSLLNLLVGNESEKVGELSLKIMRGKNTTRHVCLHSACNGILADTPGFSFLSEEFLPCSYKELKDYYPDMVTLSQKCKFSSCQHDKEHDCAVKFAIAHGEYDDQRYKRYLQIKNNLFKRWKNKYE